MPVATIDPEKWTRYDLKSAPPNPNNPDDEQGYVMLRPLPFGMLLERNDNAMAMQMKARRPQDRRRKGGQADIPTIDMKTLNRDTTVFDFQYCIGDHNLTYPDGNKVDFSNPLVFKVLDPKIAQEISGYIDELNNLEDDQESDEDFIKRATSSPGEMVDQN